MEKNKEGAPPTSNAKARSPVPKTPKAVTGESAKRSYQSQTLSGTGNTSEESKPSKKWTSLNAPPVNAPNRSRSASAMRPQSISVFESSATWYTDDLTPNHEDRRWTVKGATPDPSKEKKRPQWHSGTTAPTITAPTVSVTDADSSLEERKGGQASGLSPASRGHSGRRVPPPPPKPPPPAAHHTSCAKCNQDTPPNKALRTSQSVKHHSTQALSPNGNSSKMNRPTIAPSRSMENLKTHSPSPLSISPTAKSYSLLQFNTLPSRDDPLTSQLLSPVSPMDGLFVTTSQDSLEEVAFTALLNRWGCMHAGFMC